jgi:hypothetical protein
MKPNREVCRQCQEKFLSEFWAKNSDDKWEEGWIVCPVFEYGAELSGVPFFVEESGGQIIGYVGCVSLSQFDEFLPRCKYATEHIVSTEKTP